MTWMTVQQAVVAAMMVTRRSVGPHLRMAARTVFPTSPGARGMFITLPPFAVGIPFGRHGITTRVRADQLDPGGLACAAGDGDESVPTL